MAPALPVVTAKKCLKALKKAGFVIDHQTGSHARLIHATHKELRVTVPIHNRDLPRGTLKSILRQAKLSNEEFIDLL
ncbi:MAG TPA: type II toxin-antitoxin system HicA family toxin [Candidatus Andersenbacteria bacterium]|nr:type II toxin-antitoxin system HicA family toxin [Candidatus Andersenbacteria bacterium]